MNFLKPSSKAVMKKDIVLLVLISFWTSSVLPAGFSIAHASDGKADKGAEKTSKENPAPSFLAKVRSLVPALTLLQDLRTGKKCGVVLTEMDRAKETEGRVKKPLPAVIPPENKVETAAPVVIAAPVVATTSAEVVGVAAPVATASVATAPAEAPPKAVEAPVLVTVAVEKKPAVKTIGKAAEQDEADLEAELARTAERLSLDPEKLKAASLDRLAQEDLQEATREAGAALAFAAGVESEEEIDAVQDMVERASELDCNASCKAFVDVFMGEGSPVAHTFKEVQADPAVAAKRMRSARKHVARVADTQAARKARIDRSLEVIASKLPTLKTLEAELISVETETHNAKRAKKLKQEIERAHEEVLEQGFIISQLISASIQKLRDESIKVSKATANGRFRDRLIHLRVLLPTVFATLWFPLILIYSRSVYIGSIFSVDEIAKLIGAIGIEAIAGYFALRGLHGEYSDWRSELTDRQSPVWPPLHVDDDESTEPKALMDRALKDLSGEADPALQKQVRNILTKLVVATMSDEFQPMVRTAVKYEAPIGGQNIDDADEAESERQAGKGRRRSTAPADQQGTGFGPFKQTLGAVLKGGADLAQRAGNKLLEGEERRVRQDDTLEQLREEKRRGPVVRRAPLEKRSAGDLIKDIESKRDISAAPGVEDDDSEDEGRDDGRNDRREKSRRRVKD